MVVIVEFELRAGYEYLPYSSLESVIEQSKDAYYLSLRQTQGTIRTETPDWQPWLTFFLRSLQQQKSQLEKKIERERLILGDLPELSVQILELCRERGRVTVADAANVTGVSRNTIKDHLKALTKAGHIARHGAARGTALCKRMCFPTRRARKRCKQCDRYGPGVGGAHGEIGRCKMADTFNVFVLKYLGPSVYLPVRSLRRQNPPIRPESGNAINPIMKSQEIFICH